MELTPEERRKIYEEEKARMEAEAKAQQQAGAEVRQDQIRGPGSSGSYGAVSSPAPSGWEQPWQANPAGSQPPVGTDQSYSQDPSTQTPDQTYSQYPSPQPPTGPDQAYGQYPSGQQPTAADRMYQQYSPAQPPNWGQVPPQAPYSPGPTGPSPAGFIPPRASKGNNQTIVIIAGIAVGVMIIGILAAIAFLGRSRRGVPSPPSVATTTPSNDESDTYMDQLLKRVAQQGGDTDDAVLSNIDSVDPQITYAELKKNSSRYIGQPWAFKGRVLQIWERGDHTEARISMDYWSDKVIWVEGDFTTDFVEKDQVYVIGYLAGDYNYKSQAGWDITIPALAARAIIKPGDVAKLKAAAAQKDPAVQEAIRKKQQAEQEQQRRRAEARKLLNQ